MLAIIAAVFGVISIRFGLVGIRTRLIRYRKAPIDGHGNALCEENLTGRTAVCVGWGCVSAGAMLVSVGVLMILKVIP